MISVLVTPRGSTSVVAVVTVRIAAIRHGADPEADRRQQPLPVRKLLDPVDASSDLVGFRQRRQTRDELASALRRRGRRRRRHLERGGQRIRRQLVDDARVLAEHLLETAQGFGLADERHAGHAGRGPDALEQRWDVGGRRLALEIDDDAHPIAPLRDGPVEVGRHEPEAAERGERERDQHDRADGDASGSSQVAERLADQESNHALSPGPSRHGRRRASGCGA